MILIDRKQPITRTLNLPPKVEQAYLAEARARGLELSGVVSEVLVAAQLAPAKLQLSPEEWVREFHALAHSHAN